MSCDQVTSVITACVSVCGSVGVCQVCDPPAPSSSLGTSSTLCAGETPPPPLEAHPSAAVVHGFLGAPQPCCSVDLVCFLLTIDAAECRGGRCWCPAQVAAAVEPAENRGEPSLSFDRRDVGVSFRTRLLWLRRSPFMCQCKKK